METSLFSQLLRSTSHKPEPVTSILNGGWGNWALELWDLMFSLGRQSQNSTKWQQMRWAHPLESACCIGKQNLPDLVTGAFYTGLSEVWAWSKCFLSEHAVRVKLSWMWLEQSLEEQWERWSVSAALSQVRTQQEGGHLSIRKRALSTLVSGPWASSLQN